MRFLPNEILQGDMHMKTSSKLLVLALALALSACGGSDKDKKKDSTSDKKPGGETSFIPDAGKDDTKKPDSEKPGDKDKKPGDADKDKKPGSSDSSKKEPGKTGIPFKDDPDFRKMVIAAQQKNIALEVTKEFESDGIIYKPKELFSTEAYKEGTFQKVGINGDKKILLVKTKFAAFLYYTGPGQSDYASGLVKDPLDTEFINKLKTDKSVIDYEGFAYDMENVKKANLEYHVDFGKMKGYGSVDSKGVLVYNSVSGPKPIKEIYLNDVDLLDDGTLKDGQAGRATFRFDKDDDVVSDYNIELTNGKAASVLGTIKNNVDKILLVGDRKK